MPLIDQLKQLVLRHFIELRWYNLALYTAFYVFSTWLLLWLCHESDLIHADNFIYWLLVTASTVGYGDLSPTTVAGKWVVSLYVIPLGLSLFGLMLGHAVTSISNRWRKGVRGLNSFDLQDHTVVIGWNEARTLQLITLLKHEMQSLALHRIVLCVEADIENPLPDDIDFVKVVSFTDDTSMARAAIAQARCIILDNPEDSVTMTTALYVANKNPSAHIIAYFQNESVGDLLKQHCPQVECAPSVAVEMLAKAAVDPGSSRLHHQLLNVSDGMTQYSCHFSGKTLSAQQVLVGLKHHYNATFIGVAEHSAGDLQLNPASNVSIAEGMVLYYIADERLTDIDWSKFHV